MVYNTYIYISGKEITPVAKLIWGPPELLCDSIIILLESFNKALILIGKKKITDTRRTRGIEKRCKIFFNIRKNNKANEVN